MFSCIFLLEKPFQILNIKIFLKKIKKSYKLIENNRLFIIYLILFFAWGAPSLFESVDYYFTYKLNFSNTSFSIKYMITTLAVIFSIILIKFKIINSTNKYVIALF